MLKYLNMSNTRVLLMAGVVVLSSCKDADVSRLDRGAPEYCEMTLETHRLVITITEANRVVEYELRLPGNYQVLEEYCGILVGYRDREWNMESRGSNRLEMNPSPVDGGICLEFNERDASRAVGRYLQGSVAGPLPKGTFRID
jgi:hypothetical protein